MGQGTDFTIKDILRIEVRPALGCTEPVAIALGVAAAAALLPEGTPDEIFVEVDLNIAKNALMVTIPGTNGEAGLSLAAALGSVCRNPDDGLGLLDAITDERLAEAKALVSQGKVAVRLREDKHVVYVNSRVTKDGQVAESVIEGSHDLIKVLRLNGRDTKRKADASEGTAGHDVTAMETWLKTLSLRDLIDLLNDLDDEDLDFMEKGIQMNLALADYGLRNRCGLGVGPALERLLKKSLLSRDMVMAAAIVTAAASDARMGGVRLFAMSSAGSGNHGLTATLPLWAVKDYLGGISRERLLKAVALSHMVTSYVKIHTGRLSPVCGCSIAAGAGAAAGIAFMMGGGHEEIAGAIANVIGDLAGVICDGAKGSCALKLATAASVAVRAALLAQEGVIAGQWDGIVGLSIEGTIDNVGMLSVDGMTQADRTILKILQEKIGLCP
ncbi:MAG: serine dehydratase subunit alpha family protein [Deltaproteobacteria bacterium]|nr:serine dehydratase subunit alpha family protein [Deltaproteobacteria bacterium]